MNRGHLDFLASPRWAEMLASDLLPWLQTVAELGDDVLEIGPGPGLTTDLLRNIAARVTAVETDRELAQALATRLRATNVTVIHADATAAQLPSDRYTAALCLSVIHHIPTAARQDRLFAELHRMLRPGGSLVATDSIDSEGIRKFHADDTFNPLDPATLGQRLEAVGFQDVRIHHHQYELRFCASKARGPAGNA